MVDIIVPTYNQEAYTKRCFKTIAKHTKNYRVIWIDNNSTVVSKEQVMPSFKELKSGISVWSSDNLGFVRGSNLGLKIAIDHNPRSEYILIANNDIEVTDGWLDSMVKILDENKDIVAVGPVTSNRHASYQWWEDAYAYAKEKPLTASFNSLNHDQKGAYLRENYDGKFCDVSMLCFFCTLFRKSVFENLGYLDENFGVGLGDDDDLCRRMIVNGGRIAIALDSYVFHNHRTTFKSEYTEGEIKELQKKALKYYKDKHDLH